jgi:hypothetical protein
MNVEEYTKLLSEVKELKEENTKLENELSSWREYTQKILRLVKTFRNDYVIMQNKCVQNIENPREDQVEGFGEFLRGKLHTITEVINDFHIINSIKFVDNTQYEPVTLVDNNEKTVSHEKKEPLSEEVEPMEPLRLLTDEEIEERERENGKIMNFFGIDYVMS